MRDFKGLTAALVSLGCDKNTVDSELMLGALSGAGCDFTGDMSCAQIIIINTCGFLQDAVDEAKEAIEAAIAHKRAGDCRALVVTGCAAQRYKENFFNDNSDIDAVLGVQEYGRILEVLTQALGGVRYVDFDNTNSMEDVNRLARVRSTPRHYAYLKIAEGCDKHCTYCTIPQIRGPYKSREMQSLIDEARLLAGDGVRELILIAQDTTLYGADVHGKPILHELLRELAKIDNIRWIRLMYCYPENIYDELVAEIARNDKVLRYIDMPIQHASDNILRLMGRGTTQEALKEIIANLRQKLPGVTLRTTLIAGFPGETKTDFKTLCDFINDVKFDRLGVFAYSREEGTAADKLPDHLPQKTKDARKDRLMRLQQEVSADKLAQKIGEILEVCVEGFDSEAEMHFGRGTTDAPEVDGLVYIDSPSLKAGDFVQVRITNATEYDLLGVLL